MSIATLAASSVPAVASERHTFPPLSQTTLYRQAPVENTLAGAEFDACITRTDSFELGSVDDGTFNDGMRILTSIGSYHYERNLGTDEERTARANQYAASLENCTADDLRVAAYFIHTWFPEFKIEAGPFASMFTSPRAFATTEIRRMLEEASARQQRSGV